MPVQKHTHKLKKYKYSTGNAVFFCTLPDCHFKIDVGLSLGKMCICNICNNEFQLDEYTIKLSKPHCRNCGKQKVVNQDGKITYVNKQSIGTAGAIAELATNNVDSLKQRLAGTVVLLDKQDNDI